MEMVISWHYSLLVFDVHFCLLEISIDKYKSEIGDVIGEILCEEPNDEKSVDGLADILLVLNSVNTHIEYTQGFVRGIYLALKNFVENEKICLRLVQTLNKGLSDEESKSQLLNQNKDKTGFTREALWCRRNR